MEQSITHRRSASFDLLSIETTGSLVTSFIKNQCAKQTCRSLDTVSVISVVYCINSLKQHSNIKSFDSSRDRFVYSAPEHL